jgi:hypothetical protein
MRAIAPWLLVLALLPRIEDPWPDAIDLGFPVATATAGGVLGGLFFAAATSERRELAIKWGGVIGFFVGSALYLISLLVQVASSL